MVQQADALHFLSLCSSNFLKELMDGPRILVVFGISADKKLKDKASPIMWVVICQSTACYIYHQSLLLHRTLNQG